MKGQIMQFTFDDKNEIVQKVEENVINKFAVSPFGTYMI